MAERLIIRDTQQTNPADTCFVAFVPVSTQRWGTLWHAEWTYSNFSFQLSSSNATMCQIGFYLFMDEGGLHFVFFSPYPFFGGMRVGWMLSIHILCHNILHLRRQTLWLHIIWVISLYFYAADVSPCQQAPWQSKMENPPLLKCCTWVSLLSFPSLCPHQLWGSHGTLSRVQSWWWENIF